MRYAYKSNFLKIFITIVDSFGHLASFPIRIFKKSLPKTIKNILVIRLDHIGDVVNSTLVAKNIKNHFPEARLYFLISPEAKDLLKNNPYIDSLICFEASWFQRNPKRRFSLKNFLALAGKLRKQKFDLGIDLRGDFRHIVLMSLAGIKYTAGYSITGGGFLLEKSVAHEQSAHAIDKNLKILSNLGIKIVSEIPKIYTDNHYEYKTEEILKKYKLSKEDFIIVIHTHSPNPAKNWQKEKFKKLISALTDKLDARIIFIGTNKDRELNNDLAKVAGTNSINLSGEISLLTLYSLCKKARLFIGIDSGPSHIAASTGIPAIILYSGTNKKEEWAPKNHNTIVIQKEVHCSNCQKITCETNLCMEKISPEDVLLAAERLLNK